MREGQRVTVSWRPPNWIGSYLSPGVRTCRADRGEGSPTTGIPEENQETLSNTASPAHQVTRGRDPAEFSTYRLVALYLKLCYC